MSGGKRPYFEIANPEICGILKTLPRGLDVLDVGCGSGVHGAELNRAHGHLVTGVDCAEESIAKARSRLTEACVGDVTKPELYPFAKAKRFDVIVFSDILEHLYDPEAVLRAHLFLLKPEGHVLISIPNVAIWNVRASLLAGSFQYQDTGTLDRTHIRFFTRKSIRELIEAAGIRIDRARITPGILRPLVPLVKRLYGTAGKLDGSSDSASIMESGPYKFYMQWFYPVEKFVCGLAPGLLAFQFVTMGKPHPAQGGK
jgi:methionine biosynthesis protein MetW